MCLRLFTTFSSISLSVSGFMWRSLIHLDLSFVPGDKNGSICTLYMLTSSWTRTIENAIFFPLDGFSSFVKDQVTIGVWVHSWVFTSILLTYLLVSVPIPYSFYHYCSVIQLEVRDGGSSRSSFIVEYNFHYSVFFCYSKWICKLFCLTLQRIELKFWWGLHCIYRLLLARWPFLQY